MVDEVRFEERMVLPATKTPVWVEREGMEHGAEVQNAGKASIEAYEREILGLAAEEADESESDDIEASEEAENAQDETELDEDPFDEKRCGES